jgi:hypothetical protein
MTSLALRLLQKYQSLMHATQPSQGGPMPGAEQVGSVVAAEISQPTIISPSSRFNTSFPFASCLASYHVLKSLTLNT